MKTNLNYEEINTTFDDKNKVVTCRIVSSLNLSDVPIIQNVMRFDDNFINLLNTKYNICVNGWDLNDEIIIKFNTKGKARLTNTDKFDPVFGQQIAQTRAQEKAFRKAKQIYGNIIRYVEKVYSVPFFILGRNCMNNELTAYSHVLRKIENKYPNK